jgi:carboxymethylenebutenolidase
MWCPPSDIEEMGISMMVGEDQLIPTQGTDVELRAADGHQLHAYVATPATADAAGLVVLHEIFGVKPHIREVCDDYARRGFKAVAPALFDRAQRGAALGYDADGIETGRRLRTSIALEQVLLDVQAAIDSVQAPRGVAVLGYCWGGTLAFLAATRLERVACAIGYYGAQTIPFAHETPRVPVLFHFGTMDPRISEADRDTIRHHNPQIETHLFPADHGFNCNHRKEWHAPSAEKALGLTLDFMRRNMPCRPNASA